MKQKNKALHEACTVHENLQRLQDTQEALKDAHDKSGLKMQWLKDDKTLPRQRPCIWRRYWMARANDYMNWKAR